MGDTLAEECLDGVGAHAQVMRCCIGNCFPCKYLAHARAHTSSELDDWVLVLERSLGAGLSDWLAVSCWPPRIRRTAGGLDSAGCEP